MSGFRVREPEMLRLGMSLPSLTRRGAAIAALPPLGLLTLAALTPRHWNQSLHTPSACDDVLVRELVGLRPTLVAISALTASILDAYALADRLREQGIRVVLGGLHVTALPEEALLHADAVCIGEGEPVWPAILRDAEHGTLSPRYQADAPFNLANAPAPRLDLLAHHRRPRFTLQTARGCPLACEFCAASRVLGPFREKPASLIAHELNHIKARDPHATIELADDNTFAGRRDHASLLDTLAASGLNWFTECDWRIGDRPELVERLAAAGCVQMLIGIESTRPTYRGMGAKAAPLSRMMDAVGRIQDAGVAVLGCFVVGADSDTVDSIAELAGWLSTAPLADVQLTLLTPFPGSPAYDTLRAQGRLLPDRSWNDYTLFDTTFAPRNMTASELERSFHNCIRLVHSAGPAHARERLRHSIWRHR